MNGYAIGRQNLRKQEPLRITLFQALSEREEAILFIEFSIELKDELKLFISFDKARSELFVSLICAEISENLSFILSTIDSKV